ncbi:ankyrin repeat domain-containing protein [Arcobacter sp. CECT 8985]|uniref:ankyrin repeat domain-containing protein n=1 Tax=Arcobacter sp. CECT 8985 TaxID=1935424 RepID=UPI0013E95138|nr:ankyrin repeat domain-containing protein [Arcobacter sp. CECT 8985]
MNRITFFLLFIFLLKNLNAITVEEYTYLDSLMKGNIKGVKKAIEENKVNINLYDFNTPAIIYSFIPDKINLKVIKYLISKGANFDVKSQLYSPPLISAIYKNNFELVKLLLNNKVDINILDNHSQNALLIAVKKNNFKIIKLLIEKGINLNYQDKNGKNALMYSNSLKISKYLIENKINIDAKDNSGLTALGLAIKKNNFKMIELLIKNGANLNTLDKNKNSLLQKTLKYTNVKMIKYLEKFTINLENKNNLQENLLMNAVEENDLNIVKYLISKKLDKNTINIYNENLLMKALDKNHFQLLKYLVEHLQLNINHRDKKGNTSLIKATKSLTQVDIISYLVNNGADINAQNDIGNSALLLSNDLKTIKYLVNNGANINHLNNENENIAFKIPLYKYDIFKFLTSNKINLNQKNNKGENLFERLYKEDNLELLELFFKNGLDINIKNSLGYRPLHYASYNNDIYLLNILIKYSNLKLNAKDINGDTPLIIATRRENINIVKKLINLNANKFLKNNEYKTAYDYAVLLDNNKLIKLLKNL